MRKSWCPSRSATAWYKRASHPTNTSCSGMCLMCVYVIVSVYNIIRDGMIATGNWFYSRVTVHGIRIGTGGLGSVLVSQQFRWPHHFGSNWCLNGSAQRNWHSFDQYYATHNTTNADTSKHAPNTATVKQTHRIYRLLRLVKMTIARV